MPVVDQRTSFGSHTASRSQVSTGRSASPSPARPVSSPKAFFFLLLGAYLLLAPASVSVSDDGSGSTELKWLRIATLGLIGLLGLRWFHFPKPGDASRSLLMLAGGFAAAAVWSDEPVQAMAYKGLFVGSVVAGIAMANALRDTADLRALCRRFSLACLAGCGILAYIGFTAVEPLMYDGRLRIAGLNPNLLAQSTSIFAILAGFHLLVGDNRRWQRAAILCLVASTIITVFSGSRAALLMLLVGGVVLIPLMRRQGARRTLTSAFTALCLGLIASTWLYTLDEGTGATERSFAIPGAVATPQVANAHQDGLRIFDEITKNTRAEIWKHGLRRFAENPIMGVGWLSYGSGWSTLQSAYLQILAEAGAIGGILLLLFFGSVSRRIRQARRLARSTKGLHSTLATLFSACVLALLFHAAFESSAVLGSTPNSLLLGFSVAQLDGLIRHGRAFR